MDCVGVNLALWLATRAVGAEMSRADLIQNRLRDDRARRISGAEEQHIIGAISHSAPSRRAACRRSWRCLRSAACRLLLMGDARLIFTGAVTVHSAFARCVEGFPCDACGVVGPRLL